MELNDIQGLLVRGHGDMPAAAYLVLGIESVEGARQWLAGMADRITPADKKPKDLRMHLALTWKGLCKLEVTEKDFPGFRTEFIQGMATEYRSRVLGDNAESASGNWRWGGPKNDTVHMVLMVYAPDQDVLESALSTLSAEAVATGLRVLHRLDTESNALAREHFGFRDGIAQPILPGLRKKGTPENTVPLGEFILGYPNAYAEHPDSPLPEKALDPNGILPAADGNGGKVDFGKNGSYMVFRQLEQDVKGFWNFILEAVQRENPDAGVKECVQLASKMVGRWPGGAPLTCSPNRDDPKLSRKNDFLYHEKDAQGFRCPIGSHIRRSNPRDALQNNKPATAVKVSNRHRILRRGRNFGAPFAADFSPKAFLEQPDDKASRGLHFICFNANIARQFEFVQHTWNDNTKFEGLYHDPDPILGIKDTRNKADTHNFTIQAQPLRRKIRGLRRFVHMVGGAYFFMPGIRALRFLGQYQPPQSKR